jgi:hypothetical protein
MLGGGCDEGDVHASACAARDFKASESRHLDVDKQDLRLVPLECGECLSAVVNLGADFNFGPKAKECIAHFRAQ